jgi:hypothetical protein
MQYRLRTLLIVLAVAPPALAALWSVSPLSLAVLGWLALIVFALYISMSDARQHSRFSDD